MEKAYSNQDLLNIAKNNYQTLEFHCMKLNSEGYWTQPEKLLKQTIQECLDLYLQSMLLMFAVRQKVFDEQQNQFLRAVTDFNLLDIAPGEKLSKELILKAEKVVKAPPILLQLFALRDREKKTGLSIMFVDTMLNIIIAMSYLDGQHGEGVVQYVQSYFTQISAFLSEELSFLTEIDDRYIFRKISSPTFETGYVRDEVEYARMLARPVKVYTSEEHAVSDEANDSVKPVKKKKPAKPKKSKDAVKRPVKKTLNKEEIAAATAKARLELEQTRDQKRAAAAEKLMEQLNGLVGLESVKEEMQSLVNLIKVRKMRANYHMPQMEMSYHMVFTGNAGTGKTTVARIVAEIYKELGVVSKGTLVETDRSGLVAGYLGQTAMKVKEVVAQAKGGILFIDEAYSLVSRDAGDDYGIEAIDTLVKEMEDNRDDLVVIVAGYRKEMERFLKSNTGLISRFNKFIDFPDYTKEQLLDIFMVMAGQSQMTIAEPAKDKVRQYLESMDETERNAFGNARGVRNLFERIVTNQANRLVHLKQPTKEQLCMILEEDIKM